MKVQILGIEVSEGISKKSGKPYSMGTLHTLAQLAAPMGEGNIAKGSMGTSYVCDPILLRKSAHLSFPVTAEVTTTPVMRFGQRQEVIADIAPVAVVTGKAA